MTRTIVPVYWIFVPGFLFVHALLSAAMAGDHISGRDFGALESRQDRQAAGY